MYELRDYQVEGVEACLNVMRASKKKAIVVQPTGAGKSLLIAKTVKELNVPIVILQPSKELLKQNYTKYTDFGGVATLYCSSLKEKTVDSIGYTQIHGEYKKCEEVSRVTFATIGSIKKEIKTLKRLGVKHIIIDEIHLASKVGSQMRKFIKELGATNVLGLTATPIYLQGGMEGSRLVMINRSFGTMFRVIEQVTQISELVKNKYWTPLIYKIIKSDESKLKLNTTGSDYTEHSQKEYYKSNNLNDQIVEEVYRLKEEGRKRILIFVPSIEEANKLYGSIPNSAIVHSKMSRVERDFMVESFSNGEIPVAINVNVLATGYDNPEIDAIITARPTSSVALCYQQLGRGVRIHPDKKDCIIVDFSGNVGRFGKIEELTFEKIDYYGWGMFNGQGQILSDYPIMTDIKPTKDSLIKKHKAEEENKIETTDFKNSPEFYFGKFKDKKLHEVLKEKGGKSYCIWITEQKDFQWFGEKGKILKKAIYEELGLPLEIEMKKQVVKKTPYQKPPNNFNRYTDNIDLNNIKNIF